MLGARLCAIITRSSGSPNDVKSFLKSFIIVLSSGFVGLFGWYGMWMKMDSLVAEVSFNFLVLTPGRGSGSFDVTTFFNASVNSGVSVRCKCPRSSSRLKSSWTMVVKSSWKVFCQK